MKVRIIPIVALFLPFPVAAWEEDAVLSFISQVNPSIQAQRNVSKAYAQPDTVSWALQNTSLSARLGYGGTEFRDDPYTAYGGLQFNIPLSSIKEEREQALKLAAEAKETEDLHTRVIMDIAQLRSLESELASDVKRKFLKEKAAWLKERIEQGYSSEMDQLWVGMGGWFGEEYGYRLLLIYEGILTVPIKSANILRRSKVRVIRCPFNQDDENKS